jgi:protein-tyrosine phosphatase
MTPEGVALAAANNLPKQRALDHRSERLTLRHLADVDLVIAMSRSHRRAAVELAPSVTRIAFTAREFARLAEPLPSAVLESAATRPLSEHQGVLGRHRFSAIIQAIGSRRGLEPPPPSPEDDDVVDPFNRAQDVYATSALQMAPALDAIERVVRIASR